MRYLSIENQKKPKITVPFYYGWVIVTIASLGMFFSGPGQTYAISIFIDSYIEFFGWSRTTISSIYSAATLLAGLTLFLIGVLIDKYGPRKVTFFVVTMLAIACLLNSFVINGIMLFAGFFMLRLFGQGSMTLLPSTLVPRWFVKRRGRATGFLTIGSLISAASLPPLNLWLVATWGWPTAWRFWAIVLVGFFLPLVYLTMYNRPQDIGLLPDGDEKTIDKLDDIDTTPVVDKQNVIKALATDESWTVKEAMKTYAFWIILFAGAVVAFANTALVFHLFSIFRLRGVDEVQTALLLSLFPIIGFSTAIYSGFLLEKVRANYMYALGFVFLAIGMFVLYNANSLQLVVVFIIFWGLFEGLVMSCSNIIWPNYFGIEHLGKIRSVSTTAMVLASAFGPLPMGLAFDIFNGYQEAILIIAVFPILAMLLLLVAKQPVKLTKQV